MLILAAITSVVVAHHPGDINADGVVNFEDLTEVLAHWGKEYEMATGDFSNLTFNTDGITGTVDCEGLDAAQIVDRETDLAQIDDSKSPSVVIRSEGYTGTTPTTFDRTLRLVFQSSVDVGGNMRVTFRLSEPIHDQDVFISADFSGAAGWLDDGTNQSTAVLTGGATGTSGLAYPKPAGFIMRAVNSTTPSASNEAVVMHSILSGIVSIEAHARDIPFRHPHEQPAAAVELLIDDVVVATATTMRRSTFRDSEKYDFLFGATGIDHFQVNGGGDGVWGFDLDLSTLSDGEHFAKIRVYPRIGDETSVHTSGTWRFINNDGGTKTEVVRFVNAASTAGGDGTTNLTTGPNRAYATIKDATDFIAAASHATEFYTVRFVDGVYQTATARFGNVNTEEWVTFEPDEAGGSTRDGVKFQGSIGNTPMRYNYLRWRNCSISMQHKWELKGGTGAEERLWWDGCKYFHTAGDTFDTGTLVPGIVDQDWRFIAWTSCNMEDLPADSGLAPAPSAYQGAPNDTDIAAPENAPVIMFNNRVRRVHAQCCIQVGNGYSLVAHNYMSDNAIHPDDPTAHQDIFDWGDPDLPERHVIGNILESASNQAFIGDHGRDCSIINNLIVSQPGSSTFGAAQLCETSNPPISDFRRCVVAHNTLVNTELLIRNQTGHLLTHMAVVHNIAENAILYDPPAHNEPQACFMRGQHALDGTSQAAIDVNSLGVLEVTDAGSAVENPWSDGVRYDQNLDAARDDYRPDPSHADSDGKIYNRIAAGEGYWPFDVAGNARTSGTASIGALEAAAAGGPPVSSGTIVDAYDQYMMSRPDVQAHVPFSEDDQATAFRELVAQQDLAVEDAASITPGADAILTGTSARSRAVSLVDSDAHKLGRVTVPDGTGRSEIYTICWWQSGMIDWPLEVGLFSLSDAADGSGNGEVKMINSSSNVRLRLVTQEGTLEWQNLQSQVGYSVTGLNFMCLELGLTTQTIKLHVNGITVQDQVGSANSFTWGDSGAPIEGMGNTWHLLQSRDTIGFVGSIAKWTLLSSALTQAERTLLYDLGIDGLDGATPVDADLDDAATIASTHSPPASARFFPWHRIGFSDAGSLDWAHPLVAHPNMHATARLAVFQVNNSTLGGHPFPAFGLPDPATYTQAGSAHDGESDFDLTGKDPDQIGVRLALRVAQQIRYFDAGMTSIARTLTACNIFLQNLESDLLGTLLAGMHRTAQGDAIKHDFSDEAAINPFSQATLEANLDAAATSGRGPHQHALYSLAARIAYGRCMTTFASTLKTELGLMGLGAVELAFHWDDESVPRGESAVVRNDGGGELSAARQVGWFHQMNLDPRAAWESINTARQSLDDIILASPTDIDGVTALDLSLAKVRDQSIQWDDVADRGEFRFMFKLARAAHDFGVDRMVFNPLRSEFPAAAMSNYNATRGGLHDPATIEGAAATMVDGMNLAGAPKGKLYLIEDHRSSPIPMSSIEAYTVGAPSLFQGIGSKWHHATEVNWLGAFGIAYAATNSAQADASELYRRRYRAAIDVASREGDLMMWLPQVGRTENLAAELDPLYNEAVTTVETTHDDIVDVARFAVSKGARDFMLFSGTQPTQTLDDWVTLIDAIIAPDPSSPASSSGARRARRRRVVMEAARS